MKGVILDAASLGQDVDLNPALETLPEWDIHQTTREKDIITRIASADVVLSNKAHLSRTAIQNAPNLKLIVVLATGTNNVDLEAAKDAGITVCNAVGYGIASVAQHTLALMLALSTNLINYVADVKTGLWQNSESFCLLNHKITELAEKKLGIIGYGALGQAVAGIATAMGMEVLICQRPGTGPVAGRIPLENLLAEADVVTLHCPLTDQNQHLINSQRLALMQRHSLLINTARGGLVDSTALLSALQAGQIGGAAIDVLNTEPPTQTEPLLAADLGNLIVTPHNAWGALESRQRLIMQVRDNIRGFQSGNIRNRVI